MIYLVRQGETDWNLNKKFNGCTDIKLNQTGIAQAKQQAENLRNVDFKACFSSPQTRARQTYTANILILENTHPFSLSGGSKRSTSYCLFLYIAMDCFVLHEPIIIIFSHRKRGSAFL